MAFFFPSPSRRPLLDFADTTTAKLQQFQANSGEMTSQKLSNCCRSCKTFCVALWLLSFQGPLRSLCKGALVRKLEKAMVVSPGKSWENCWKILPNREMLQILGFRAPGKATCREPWVDTARTLSPPSVRGVFGNQQFQPSRVFF